MQKTTEYGWIRVAVTSVFDDFGVDTGFDYARDHAEWEVTCDGGELLIGPPALVARTQYGDILEYPAIRCLTAG